MIDTLYNLLKENLYLILSTTLILDSIPGVGFIIPDEVVMALVGFTLSELGLPLLPSVLVAGVSLVAGQLLMYSVGKRYNKKALKLAKANPETYKRVEKYMKKNDLLMNITLRLTSTIRSIFALLSGVRNYPIGKFLLFEILISFIKGGIYIEMGYLLAKNLTDVDDLTSRLGVIVGVVVASSMFISFMTSREVFRKR
jgi:membrane protein DedA with SNARE-associated domain